MSERMVSGVVGVTSLCGVTSCGIRSGVRSQVVCGQEMCNDMHGGRGPTQQLAELDSSFS